MASDSVTIREAVPENAAHFMLMIRELAEFEKMPECVEMTEEKLAADLKRGAWHGLIAFDADGAPVGMVMYYFGYSTWLGQYIHMEGMRYSSCIYDLASCI